MDINSNHRLKYSRHPDDPMTLMEVEIWHSQEVQESRNPSTMGRRGKTLKETMAELHVGKGTILKTKKKTEYNALAQARLEETTQGINEAVDNLVALTKATKKVNVRVLSKVKGKTKSEAMVIKRIEEPENTVRFNAVSEILDIFGAKAPKQVDLKHSMAAMSDDELQAEIDKSVQEIESNANTRRQVTGSLSPGAIITSTIAFAEPEVGIESREQKICPTDA